MRVREMARGGEEGEDRDAKDRINGGKQALVTQSGQECRSYI